MLPSWIKIEISPVCFIVSSVGVAIYKLESVAMVISMDNYWFQNGMHSRAPEAGGGGGQRGQLPPPPPPQKKKKKKNWGGGGANENLPPPPMCPPDR